MSALPDNLPPRWRPWTDREDRLLRKFYRSDDSAAITALVAVTGRARKAVTERASVLGLSRRVPRWTAAQEATLRWHYGHLPLPALARRLGRSVHAVRERAWALGLRRAEPFSFTTAARMLGWDWHKLAAFAERGQLASHGTRLGHARHAIDAAEWERFLREHCHEIDPERMDDPSGYYEAVVRAARDADPLLTVPEVAARLGVSCDRVRRLIRDGRIVAMLARDHGGTGTYYVRESAAVFERRRERHPNHTWRRPELVGHAGRAPR